MKRFLLIALALGAGLLAAWALGRIANPAGAGPGPDAVGECSCPDPCPYPAALCREDAAGFQDNFESRHPRWRWDETVGSGYHRSLRVDGAPAMEIGIGPGGGSAESDCSLEERAPLRRWGACSFRIRAADADMGAGGGSMGWGLWKPGKAEDIDAAWFLSCSRASDAGFRGFSAMLVQGGRVTFRKELACDPTRWHDYRIELSPEGARFLVDGRIEAESGPLPPELPCMKMVCWIDNKVVRMKDGRALVTHEAADRALSLVLSEAGFEAAGK